MKLFAIILTLAFASFSGVAQGQVTQAEKKGSAEDIASSVVDQQEHKKQIEKEELPDQVLAAFDKSVYNKWSIDKVFSIENGDQTSYELHLVLQDEKMVLLADADGNLQPKADS